MALNYAINRKGAAGYFASANTGSGFFSVFNEVYNENKLTSLYILKGGPGTGKSTLMNRIAAEAEKNGLETEIYLCSSDPCSIDGVIIKELGVAVVDGTAPHTVDPIFPGVCGEIINLGENWDPEKLKTERETLEELFSEKSGSYKRAYRYLNAAGIAEEDVIIGAEKIINKQKTADAIYRMIRKYCVKKGVLNGGNIRKIFTSCYGSGGEVHIPTLEKRAETVIKVTVEYGVDSLILDKTKEIGERLGLSMEVSIDPLLPEHTEAVFFSDSKTLFIKEKISPLTKNEILLNSHRFISKERLAENRQKLRFSQKMQKTLVAEALLSLKKSGEIHSKIEGIYKSAMCFDGVSEISVKLIGKIFG